MNAHVLIIPEPELDLSDADDEDLIDELTARGWHAIGAIDELDTLAEAIRRQHMESHGIGSVEMYSDPVCQAWDALRVVSPVDIMR